MRIREILKEKFVKTDEVSAILELALTGKKNVILYGPAGHGKSEMVQAVIEGLGLKKETFTQFFGEGMDEARLFGGVDFLKLDVDRIIEYNVERSFLNYRIAVFEEIFDAPPNVLLALKDVLTSRELRNGSQRVPMKAEVIICLTNREPAEISDLGPAAHALIERFPLQLNVKWDKYEKIDYLELLEKVAPRLEGPVMNGFKPVLAELLANATASGHFVSPRTAVHAFQIVQSAAQIAGRNHVEKEDLAYLRFLPGLEGMAKTIEKEVEAATLRQQAAARIAELTAKVSRLFEMANEESRPIKLLQLSKTALVVLDEVNNLRVPDALVKDKETLSKKILAFAQDVKEKALNCTYGEVAL